MAFLVATVLVLDRTQPNAPSLRVGMSPEEVEKVFGETPLTTIAGWRMSQWLVSKPDLLGNQQIVVVSYDHDRVEAWKVSSFRTRPPWLDRALNGIGW
jgi:hypothetical protein